uniref:Uncharacterized protein n=1 Tax=Knipowitschia caucasica TaxID=637954 RepID=A0AAV2KUW1_KNICA
MSLPPPTVLQQSSPPPHPPSIISDLGLLNPITTSPSPGLTVVTRYEFPLRDAKTTESALNVLSQRIESPRFLSLSLKSSSTPLPVPTTKCPKSTNNLSSLAPPNQLPLSHSSSPPPVIMPINAPRVHTPA